MQERECKETVANRGSQLNMWVKAAVYVGDSKRERERERKSSNSTSLRAQRMESTRQPTYFVGPFRGRCWLEFFG